MSFIANHGILLDLICQSIALVYPISQSASCTRMHTKKYYYNFVHVRWYGGCTCNVCFRFSMSTNAKNPFTKTRPSRWGHPLVFVASAIGLLGSSAVYYAQIRARQRARSRYLIIE